MSRLCKSQIFRITFIVNFITRQLCSVSFSLLYEYNGRERKQRNCNTEFSCWQKNIFELCVISAISVQCLANNVIEKVQSYRRSTVQSLNSTANIELLGFSHYKVCDNCSNLWRVKVRRRLFSIICQITSIICCLHSNRHGCSEKSIQFGEFGARTKRAMANCGVFMHVDAVRCLDLSVSEQRWG